MDKTFLEWVTAHKEFVSGKTDNIEHLTAAFSQFLEISDYKRQQLS